MNIYETLLSKEQDLFNYFSGMPGEVTNSPERYVYVDRGHPVCLVAHVDTLPRKEVCLVEHNGIITNKHGLLGADDRAGVYGCMALADTGCNILITAGEECGGIGARQAALDLGMTGVNLMIELDRAHCNDYVFYSWGLPKQIHNFCQSFGYIESYGSYSDISEFPHIPAVNLSIGYYNQHTTREELHLDEMNMSIARVRGMILQAPKKRYRIPMSRKEYSWDLPDYRERY